MKCVEELYLSTSKTHSNKGKRKNQLAKAADLVSMSFREAA
jgi:hypothetical protein